MQYLLSHNINSETCMECKGCSVLDDGKVAFTLYTCCMQISVFAGCTLDVDFSFVPLVRQ